MKLKRKLNNVDVEIGNIDLLMEAEKGKVLRSKLKYEDGYKSILELGDTDVIKELIEDYNKINNLLPYPLNYIESDLKYTAIATYIITECDSRPDTMIANISEGINIKVNDNDILKLQYGNAKVVEIDKSKDFVASDINIETFSKDTLGYEHFEWILNKVSSGQSVDSYYLKFMPEIYNIFNGDKSVIAKSLEHVLKPQGSIPIYEYKYNCIMNSAENSLYHISVYPDGAVENTDEVVNTFTYNTAYYQNISSPSIGVQRDITKCIESLMKIICTKYNNRIYDCKWYGYIGNKYMTFSLDGMIWYTDIDEYKTPKILHHNGRILNMVGDSIYLDEIYKVDNDTVQIITMKYDLSNYDYEIIGITYR